MNTDYKSCSCQMRDPDLPKRLSDHRQTILELRRKDPTFEELWHDYIEVSRTLDELQSEDNAYSEFERLQESLEREILDLLN